MAGINEEMYSLPYEEARAKYGTRNGNSDASAPSFYNFFVKVNKSATSTNITNLFNDAISKIGNMPAPFVKYCSTIWNLPYENDERTADDLPEEE